MDEELHSSFRQTFCIVHGCRVGIRWSRVSLALGWYWPCLFPVPFACCRSHAQPQALRPLCWSEAGPSPGRTRSLARRAFSDSIASVVFVHKIIDRRSSRYFHNSTIHTFNSIVNYAVICCPLTFSIRGHTKHWSTDWRMCWTEKITLVRLSRLTLCGTFE